MARVNRSSVLLWLQDVLGLQSGANQVPIDTPNSIQPVIDVFPRRTTFWRNATQTATANSTVFTTPADKDFYLTYAEISITKDATNDNTSSFIVFVQDGANRRICDIRTQTTTAGTFVMNTALSHPIKLDRNTNVSLQGTFTAGTMTKNCSIGGFILE